MIAESGVRTTRDCTEQEYENAAIVWILRSRTCLCFGGIAFYNVLTISATLVSRLDGIFYWEFPVPRVVSFIVLLAVIILIGSMFFQVMVQFIVPLFLAAVLVVIFKPLHQWVLEKCGHRIKLSAAVTTLLIVLIVLLPISAMLMKAVSEGVAIVRDNTAEGELNIESVKVLVDKAVHSLNRGLEKLKMPEQSSDNVYAYVRKNLGNFAAPLLLGGVEILASTLIGLAIMVLTMYYFFSDGPSMAAAMMKLSPMDDVYEQELLDKFGDVSRAVVLASLLSAIVQGLLAGVGYMVAGVDSIFFWTALTIFLAMVPFVGSAAVWIPICLYLYFVQEESTTAAIVLAIYCVVVVSMIDNLIKPMVLHGQSNLHPLLALLSVIGGIQALGPIGILVGPMLVAFLQALLNMLNKELHLLGQESDATGKPVVFATSAASTVVSDPPTSLPQPSSPQSKPSQKRKRKKKK